MQFGANITLKQDKVAALLIAKQSQLDPTPPATA
jgi:hypothetical protein